jgi:hypothetical protein
MEQTPTRLLSWISSVLPILVCQMAIPQRGPRRSDNRRASESLLEQRQNLQRPYSRWERERRLCPRKSSAKVLTQISHTILLEVHADSVLLVADREESKDVPRRTRDCDIIPTNPTHLLFRLQHLILTQTQRLLEECCYTFAETWLPSMLEANGWGDTPVAVELTEWWKALSNYHICGSH